MNPDAPIQYFNRYTRRIETEQVYGDAFLRWAYRARSGRAALHTVVKRRAFSSFYGWLMDSARSADRIAPFIEKFRLDPHEFERSDAAEYASFNEFFHRALRPGARPIDLDPDAAVFPADGRHLGFPDASNLDGVFVKGQHFNLPALLGDAVLGARYHRATLVLSRLCPVDYHRFHFPICGVPGPARILPGPLYSVNPIALRRRLAYLWENRRAITQLRSERFGNVVIVEIGATNVGSIRQTFQAGRPVAKGSEKGYFRFGGSSTILLFEPGRIRLADDLVAHSREGRELYARVGDRMATRIPVA